MPRKEVFYLPYFNKVIKLKRIIQFIKKKHTNITLKYIWNILNACLEITHSEKNFLHYEIGTGTLCTGCIIQIDLDRVLLTGLTVFTALFTH